MPVPPRRRRLSSLRSLATVLAVVVSVALAATPALADPVGAAARSATTARSVPRLQTITIPDTSTTIAPRWLDYPGPPRADVLLPAGYDPRRRYPLLILLHGLNCNYATIAESGVLPAFRDLQAIVVMPEGGSGWYTDWWNGGRRDGPDWESYELDDVLPAVLSRYPILPGRRYHAIAGISMGGLGAAYLGGRLPGFFGTVATLSGFDDPGYFAPLVAPAMGVFSGAVQKGDGHVDPVAGPPGGFYFRGHDPTVLAGNLRHSRVFVTSGTGVPSQTGLETLPAGALNVLAGSVAEGAIISPMGQRYNAALVRAGVPVTYRTQPGGHLNPDFQHEIDDLLTWGLFGPVSEAPKSWTNDTVAADGTLWNVGYRFARPPTHLVRFRLTGSTLAVGDAGSPVTLTTRGGCTVRTTTPAAVRLPAGACPTVTSTSRPGDGRS